MAGVVVTASQNHDEYQLTALAAESLAIMSFERVKPLNGVILMHKTSH